MPPRQSLVLRLLANPKKKDVTNCDQFCDFTGKEIQMLQALQIGEIKFEYVRLGLKIRTTTAADHKAVITKL